MEQTYSYQQTLADSAKASWKIEDIIGGDKRLDFTKCFLPESLARVDGMSFLTAREKTIYNQIRGHNYLCTFGLVEEFILPFVMDHARQDLDGDDHRTRALLQFASEEAKHIHLFKIFREEFEQGFGSTCDVIGPPEAVAKEVLSHHPLAVAVLVLHIEWMVQRHFIEGVRDDKDLDPLFKSLLKHHWMEECQHAKMDTLMVEAIAAKMSAQEIDAALGEYLEIGAFLDAGLKEQVLLDTKAFERATGREFSEAEREVLKPHQHQAYRWTFIGSGMSHPEFLATLERALPGSAEKFGKIAQAFS